jgi:hypothetical protein
MERPHIVGRTIHIQLGYQYSGRVKTAIMSKYAVADTISRTSRVTPESNVPPEVLIQSPENPIQRASIIPRQKLGVRRSEQLAAHQTLTRLGLNL